MFIFDLPILSFFKVMQIHSENKIARGVLRIQLNLHFHLGYVWRLLWMVTELKIPSVQCSQVEMKLE